MNTDFIKKLSLNNLLKLREDYVLGRCAPELDRMFTDDVSVINFRLDALTDLLENDLLFDGISQLLPDISVLREVRALNTGMPSKEIEGLYTIRDLNIYVGLIVKLYEILGGCEVRSELFSGLKRDVIAAAEDTGFEELKNSIPENADIITSLQSVTIGVNLDRALHPVEAAVVSLNKEKFTSGRITDRIIRLSAPKERSALAQMTSLFSNSLNDEERERTGNAINSALFKVIKSSFKQWKPAIKSYISQNTDFLVNRANDLRFLVSAATLCHRLKEAGYPICRPKVCEMSEKKFNVKGAYCPELALGTVKTIGNDIEFGNLGENNGMIYIFTGANGGGKTVFAKTIGICQALLQLGVYIPAEYAEISPAKEILVHSSTSQTSISQSRFTEECAKLSAVMKLVNEDTMILCDEALSGTSAFEAAAIAEEVVKAMSAKGCRGIFITHIHELSALPDKLNKLEVCRSRIGNLAVLTDEASGVRTYKTVRGKAPGKSYASDIAEKYGLSFDTLMKN